MKFNKRAWVLSMAVATIVVFMVIIFSITIYSFTSKFKEVNIDISQGKAMPYFDYLEGQRFLASFYAYSYFLDVDGKVPYSIYSFVYPDVKLKFNQYSRLVNGKDFARYAFVTEFSNYFNVDKMCEEGFGGVSLDNLKNLYSPVYFVGQNFILTTSWVFIQKCNDKEEIK